MQTLYPYQRQGVAWLSNRRNALLMDAMGLGKTAQALCAAPSGVPVLAVVPACVKGVWANEAAMWRPDLRVTILSGRGSFRWPDPGELFIINPDILPELTAKALPPEIRWPYSGTVLIADEAHVFKSHKAARTKVFRLLAKRVAHNAGRVWLLTGTPLMSKPTELYSVLAAADLDVEAFGKWPEFVCLFGGYKGKFGYTWGKPDASVPERLRRVSLSRRREDVLPDLPEKTYRDISVPTPDEIKILCEEAWSRYVKEAQAAGVDIDALLDRFKVGMPLFHEFSACRMQLAAAKIPAMLELVEQYENNQEPLIVFSAHRAAIDTLGVRPGWKVITGDTLAERRTAIVSDFQAGKLKGLGLTIAAGAVGLTLTRAAHVLFVDLAWTPAMNAQAEARALRIGQTRGVLITRLVCDVPLDQHVTRLLAKKQRLIAATVEASAVTDYDPLFD